jgi:hypothetical protein
MRARMLGAAVLAAVAVAAPAQAAPADAGRGKMTVRTKIAGFSVAQGRLVANGAVTARLAGGGEVVRDRARVRFRIAQQTARAATSSR